MPKVHSGLRWRARILVCSALLVAANGIPFTDAAAQDPVTPSFTRTSDVIYGRKAGLALTMEVLVPRVRNGLGVIWVVSSGGRSSPEQTFRPTFERRIAPLLDHGYVVFAVVHGSSPAFQIDAFAPDIRRAVRFIRYHARRYDIDGEHLGIAGSSSGGATALLVALDGRSGDEDAQDPVERQSARVQAAASFFAPTDFLNFADQTDVVSFMRGRYGVVDPSFQFFEIDSTGHRTAIRDPEEVARRLEEVSPATHATADDPPVLLIHGREDRLVPVQQSRLLYEQLRALGVRSELVIREGQGHAWAGWEADSELIAGWFDVALRPGPHDSHQP